MWPAAHLQLLLLLPIQTRNGSDGGCVQPRVAQLQPPQLGADLALLRLLVLELVLQQCLHAWRPAQHKDMRREIGSCGEALA